MSAKKPSRPRSTGKGDGQPVPPVRPVAILTADWHLSHRPPLARSGEPDWYKAMVLPLIELHQLSRRLSCPVICAGDIFDRWNAPAELINFACAHMPHIYAVAGQHDLPYHRYDDISRSALWTLMEAGRVSLLLPGLPLEYSTPGGPIRMHGFPWGSEPRPNKKRHPLVIEIAVVHAYCWMSGLSYPGAKREHRGVLAWQEKLTNYDIVVFGDNHIPFEYLAGQENEPHIFNCGSLMRRTADQIEHHPSVGILYSDLTIQREYLNIEDETFTTVHQFKEGGGPLAEALIDELRALDEVTVDFRDMVLRLLDRQQGISTEVRELILRAMGEENGPGKDR